MGSVTMTPWPGIIPALVLTVLAGPARTDTAVIPPAYVAAARANAVPPRVLYAVARAESGVSLPVGRRPWPWTLNVAGTAHRFKTRSRACRALRSALASTTVVDVGLGQLNVRWNPDLFGGAGRFSNPCSALDPYDNLDAAAKLLRDRYRGDGDWVAAAGRYHRPAGGAPAHRYRAAIRREMQRLANAKVFIQPHSPNAVAYQRPAPERTLP